MLSETTFCLYVFVRIDAVCSEEINVFHSFIDSYLQRPNTDQIGSELDVFLAQQQHHFSAETLLNSDAMREIGKSVQYSVS